MLRSVGIIGSGLAAASVATSLRQHGFDGQIAMFGEEDHHAYERPSLSKSALVNGNDSPSSIYPESWVSAAGIELHGSTAVAAIEAATGTIQTHDGNTFAFDRLVLATGVRARRLNIPGAGLPGILVLRTWADMLALRQRIQPGCRLAIVGGGLVGCEVASTAAKLGALVTIFEANDELLERVLGRQVGAQCREDLQAMGVEVRLGARLAAFEGDGHVGAVRTSDGAVTHCDTALVCIGAIPADELAQAAGIACGNGVLVDATGKSTADNVYAAGDVANWPLASGGSRSLETYLNAQGQAECVARALLGNPEPSLQTPKGWTEIAGKKIQMIGDIDGPGRIETRRVGDGASVLSFRTDPTGVLCAALAVNAPGDFAAMMRLVDRKYRPLADELSDPSVSLRDLVKKSR